MAELVTAQSLVPAGMVPIYDPLTNKVQAVPHEDAQWYLDSGRTLATTEQLEDIASQKNYGDRPIAAGAAGIARGATLGISDIIATKSGLVEPETLTGLQEQNPIASGVGEIGGVVLPAILSGGAGAAGKAASVLPSGLLAKAGVATARATEKELSRSLIGSGLNRFARKAIIGAGSLGAAGALEGGIYTGATGFSEEMLENPELAAESLLSAEGFSELIKRTGRNVLKGAAIGTATGGALGVAGAAAAPVTEATLKRISSLTDNGWGKIRAYAATKSFGPYVSEAKKINKWLKGPVEVGNDIIEEGIISPGASLEKQVANATARRSQWGQFIGDVIEQADQVADGTEGALTSAQLRSAVKKQVFADMKSSGAKSMNNAVKKVIGEIRGLESFSSDSPLTLAQITKDRRMIDTLLDQHNFWSKTTEPTPWLKGLYRVRGVMDDLVEERFRSVMRSVSVPEEISAFSKALAKESSLENALDIAKRKYSVLTWAKEAGERRMAHEFANRLASPSDYGVGAVIAGAGSVAAGAINPASIVAGFFAGTLNQVVRKRGASLIASLPEVQGFNRITKAIANHNASISRAAKGVLSEKVGASAPIVAVATSQELRSAQAARDSVEEAILNGYGTEAISEAITENLSNLNEFAPNTTTSVALKASAALRLLTENVPKRSEGPFSAFDSVSRGSKAQVAKWRRIKEAIDRPNSILESIERGIVNPEAIQVLRVVYPATYMKLRNEIMEGFGNLESKPSYRTRLLLTKLFDSPMDDSVSPSRMSALQRNFQSMAENQEHGPTGNISLTQEPTNIQRAEAR